MKIIEVPIKPEKRASAPSEPKVIKVIREKLYLPAPRKVTKKERQSIQLFGVWTVAFFSFTITFGDQVSVLELFWYFGFLVSLMMFLMVQRMKETDEAIESTRISITESLPAFALWGGLIFGLNFFMLVGSGANLRVPSLFEILRQAIVVVPCESFIFLVLLPPVLDAGISSKIPLMPGFLMSQILFGLYHTASGSLPLELGIFAIFMGLIWYTVYRMGRIPKYGKYFGIQACLAWHFTHNITVMSAMDVAGDPVVALFRMLMGIG